MPDAFSADTSRLIVTSSASGFRFAWTCERVNARTYYTCALVSRLLGDLESAHKFLHLAHNSRKFCRLLRRYRIPAHGAMYDHH